MSCFLPRQSELRLRSLESSGLRETAARPEEELMRRQTKARPSWEERIFTTRPAGMLGGIEEDTGAVG